MVNGEAYTQWRDGIPEIYYTFEFQKEADFDKAKRQRTSGLMVRGEVGDNIKIKWYAISTDKGKLETSYTQDVGS